MRLYNPSTDTIAVNITAYYKKGFVAHYVATDESTGKKIKIDKAAMGKDWIKDTHIDIAFYRKNK